MIPGGSTEIIWHFAGHFKIIHDITRDRIDYDPSSFHSRPDDYVTPRPEHLFTADLDDFNSHGLSVAPLALFDELHAGRIHPIRLLSAREPEPDFEPLLGLPGSAIRPGGGGGGAAVEAGWRRRYRSPTNPAVSRPCLRSINTTLPWTTM